MFKAEFVALASLKVPSGYLNPKNVPSADLGVAVGGEDLELHVAADAPGAERSLDAEDDLAAGVLHRELGDAERPRQQWGGGKEASRTNLSPSKNPIGVPDVPLLLDSADGGPGGRGHLDSLQAARAQGRLAVQRAVEMHHLDKKEKQRRKMRLTDTPNLHLCQNYQKLNFFYHSKVYYVSFSAKNAKM